LNSFMSKPSPQTYHDPQPSDFSVCISDGMCCLVETIDKAARESNKLADIIESRMESKLEQAVLDAGQVETPLSPGIKM